MREGLSDRFVPCRSTALGGELPLALERGARAIAAQQTSADETGMSAMGRKLSPADPAHRGLITNSPIATGASSAFLSTASPVAPNHIKPLSTSKRHLYPHGDVAPH